MCCAIMMDAFDSVLPESLRDHPTLTRLRASLRADTPDRAGLDSADTDPVDRALALSGLSPAPPDVTE